VQLAYTKLIKKGYKTMPYQEPIYPNQVWDGRTGNPWRTNRNDDLSPDSNDWDRLSTEVIATQQHLDAMAVLVTPEEYSANPVLTHVTDRAYYPTLLYFKSGFTVEGNAYKYICIHSNDVGVGGLIMSGSNDFKVWTDLNSGNPLVGLPVAAHHPIVVQTGASAFRLFYWDSNLLYTVAAIRTAVSTDLINWSSDAPLQNGSTPFITEGDLDWNRGSYGACHVIYNPTASNTGAHPLDYSYAMYFNATSGGKESMGLAYSADGVTFNLYGELLPTIEESVTPWDGTYQTWGSIIRTPLGQWCMFYSGGTTASYQGVGLALSTDGLNWHRVTVNAPTLGLKTGTWREQRCYAVSVIADFEDRFAGCGDDADVKMLVSGKNAAGVYACGYFKIPNMYLNPTELMYRLVSNI